MKGGNYSMKTFTDISSKACFERERLREREREARAQMTYEADQQRISQDVMNSAPLFGEIVRVNPKSNDKERQQIERKLGRFEDVKHLLADQDVTNLFGVDGQPPPSPAPNVNSGSSSIGSHEFKKPNACLQSHPTKSSHHHHHHHHHSSSAQRNMSVKPNDGKMMYASRGSFYSGPSSKHCNVPPMLSVKTGGNSTTNSSFGVGSSIGANSNDNSSSMTAAANYHYGSTSVKASSSTHEYATRIQQSVAKNLPKINCELRDSVRGADCSDDSASSVSQTNVENILDEMTSALRTPLTAIAATPRKEVESKFTFNPISGKVESLLPLSRTSIDKGTKTSTMNNMLGSGGGSGNRAPLISPAFRSDRNDESTTLLQPFNSTHLPAAGNTIPRSGSSIGVGYAYSAASVAERATSLTNKEKIDSTTLPCLKSDLSLSEDTDDGDGVGNDNDEDVDCDDDDDDDDDENSDDGDNEEEEDETRRRRQRARNDIADEKDSNKYKMISGTVFASKKEPTSSSAPSNIAEDLQKCETVATNEVRNSSSSDDSDSDSGSESEDSSSDSPSPPSLPLPVVTEQEESKHRWNLKNFLPPSAHNSQACRRPQNCDSDNSTSNGNSVRRAKTRVTSCSTSDSDNDADSDKSCAPSRLLAADNGKAMAAAAPALATTVAANSAKVETVTGANNNGTRPQYQFGSSPYSQSSEEDDDDEEENGGGDDDDDDSDRALSYVTSNSVRNSGSIHGIAVVGSGDFSGIAGGNATAVNASNSNGSGCSTSVGCGGMVVTSSIANSSNCGSGNNYTANVTGAGSNSGSGASMTVVGVVKPHQRKPPSPQIFHHNGRNRNVSGNLRDLSPATNDERYTAFVQQRTMHLGATSQTPEPQCDLSASHAADSGIVMKNTNRTSLINNHYQQGGNNNNNNNNNNRNNANNKCNTIGGSSSTITSVGVDNNIKEDDNRHDRDYNVRSSTLESNGKSNLAISKTGGSSKVRRKSKSPALASSNESPVKKKRGRKRTIKVPDLSDSDEETPKTKTAPEKKRPGRPPLKRNDASTAEDMDWNSNSSSRRKIAADKFASSAANIWCDRERRRSSLRMSSFTTVDSDSDPEILTATVKPTARVMPAVKRKDGGSSGGGSVRTNRDSSCESMRNDNDFNVISESSIKGGGCSRGGSTGDGNASGAMVKAQESPPKLDVECIAVQDKKKSDTLRKLFSRREEGGGKTGGKGKGGKGKCGVIVMESEVERKLLQRSSAVSPTSSATSESVSASSNGTSNTPSAIQDRVPDMTHVAISSSNLRSNSGDNDGARYSETSCIHSAMNSGDGGVAVVEQIPKLTYNKAGKPSLMCKIDLSKISYILAKKRSEEIRIKCELPDTRQSSSSSLTNSMLDHMGGGVNAVSTIAAASSVDMSNVPLIEPLPDRRRNNCNSSGSVAAGPATLSAVSQGSDGVNASTVPTIAVEHDDLYRVRSSVGGKQYQRIAAPSASPLSRNKHSSNKKTKNSKRKHYVDEPPAMIASPTSTAAAVAVAPAVEENNTVASIFGAASTVHTPSVDTADMDSPLSSDSETRKLSAVAASSLAHCTSKNKKRSGTATSIGASLASTPASDSIHSNLMTTCYPIGGLNDARGQNSNAVVDQSSADDESWNSSESSCSNCSTSSTSCLGGGGVNDKYSKVGKRSSSQYRRTRGQKRKKKLRNEHSQRHSALSDCGSGGVGSAPDLIHIPPNPGGHERSSTSDQPPATAFNGYHQVAISDLVRPTVPSHHGIYYSYLEHKASEEINSESDNVSPNLYLMEAKRLKHAADTERDSVAQGMQYLEAILSFVLTGHVLERKNQMDTAFNMYSETLKLIVYISKKFRTLCTNVTPSSIPNKIAILSLRCESILNLKLYTMRENEVREVHTAVAEYFSKPVTVEACLMGNAAGIPSPHSPTPSPASSVGSNSSGYSSGDRKSIAASKCVAVPLNLHVALQKQHNFYSNLIASFSYWEEADKLIFSGGNKDFFIELDRFCGPLTLHSSLKDLVHYVRVGIQRLKAIISHNHGV